MSIAKSAESRHLVIPEKADRMVKAEIRKSESDDALKEIGSCLDYARREVGWNLDQLADAVNRDPRQVQRWIDGKERTQIDTVFRVKELRAPFVVALARLAQDDFEETTVLTRRRPLPLQR